MNSKISATLGGCLLAFIFGLAWFGHQSAGHADAALRALAKKRAALDAAILRGEKQLAAVNRDRRTLPVALSAPPAREIKLPASVAVDGNLNYRRLLLGNPAYPALAARAFRANLAGELAGQYGAFYRALNLTPGQIGKFEDLMANHFAEMMNAGAAVSLPEDQLREDQLALLGDAGYQQLQEYDRVAPVSGIVNQVAYAVALSSEPLSGPQIDAISQILARSSSSFQSGGAADPATINWEVALAQAQGVLSEPQFAALRRQYGEAQIGPMVAEFNREEAAAK